MVTVKMSRQAAEELVDLLLVNDGNYWRDEALRSLVMDIGMVKDEQQYDEWLTERWNRGELKVYAEYPVSARRGLKEQLCTL